MTSTEGPALAVADINHDGLEDVFVGASKTFHNAVYLQTTDGKFAKLLQPDMLKDSMWENVDAVWVDVNNDTHVDLVIASGGNEYYGKDEHLMPLLYLNDGKGNLTGKNDAFADIYTTQSVVVTHDFNGDGFVDLFIGSKTEPWAYGQIPRSFLLQNDGTGKFTDVTKIYSTELVQPGMVTYAQWLDINNDNKKDLILCYEWGGIDAFLSKQNKLTKKELTDKKGWWNFVLPCDIDNDGDIDFIAGNFGLNSRLKASDKEPVSLYFNDFDDNGRKEQIITYYLKGEEIPFATKQDLEKQLPGLKKNFLYAEDFAKSSLLTLFGAAKMKKAEKLTANYFSNAVLVNNGNMHFEARALPFEAQLSTFRNAVVVDANKDALPDVFMLGNYYDNNVEIGRQDADFGTMLINRGNGRFEYQPINGMAIKGQVRKIKPLQVKQQHAFVLTKNNDSLVVVRFK